MEASHSLTILPHTVHRSSSSLDSSFSCALLPLLPDVMEICDVSDDLREWPLCSEFRLFASVSMSLKANRA